MNAIINSDFLYELAKPLMSKGQFGPRDLQKHLWRLPIPGFNPGDQLHADLAEAGAETEAAAQEVWQERRTELEKASKKTDYRAARRVLREWLADSDEGRRVEELVARLLTG